MVECSRISSERSSNCLLYTSYAVESACHERVVVRCIAENNEFCASTAVVLFACLRRLLDDLTHKFDSIHVDTGFGRAKVDGACLLYTSNYHQEECGYEFCAWFGL